MLAQYGNFVTFGFIMMSLGSLSGLIVSFLKKDYSFGILLSPLILLIGRLSFFINERNIVENLVTTETAAKNFTEINKYLLVFDLAVFIVSLIEVIKNKDKKKE